MSNTETKKKSVLKKAPLTVALLTATGAENVAHAMEAVLQPRVPGANFKIVNSINEIPKPSPEERVRVACVGFPTHLKQTTYLEKFGTAYDENQAVRDARWAIVRNPKLDPEEISRVLNTPDGFLIIPQGQLDVLNSDLAELKIALTKVEPGDHEARAEIALEIADRYAEIFAVAS